MGREPDKTGLVSRMARHEYRLEKLGWSNYLGATDTLVPVEFLGRRFIRVQEQILQATLALQAALRNTGYEDPCDYTGSYMMRTIGGKGDMWSSHAYGLAIDLDYGYSEPDRLVDNNPYLGFRPTREQYGSLFQLTWDQVQACKAIRNHDGDPLWLWLGDSSIGDTMHFQINVAPQFTNVDWSTVAGHIPIPPIDEEDELTITDLVTDATWQALYDAGHIEGDPAVMPQYYFADGPAPDSEKIHGYNVAIQSFIADLKAAEQGGSQELVDQVNTIEASLDDTQTKLRSV